MVLEEIQNSQLGLHHRNKEASWSSKGCFIYFENIHKEWFVKNSLKVVNNLKR